MRWKKILSNSKIVELLKNILNGFVGDKKVPTKSGNPYHSDGDGRFISGKEGGGKKKKLTAKEKREADKQAKKAVYQQREDARQQAQKEEDERKAKEAAEKQAYKEKMDDFYNRKFEIKKQWKDEEARLNHVDEKGELKHQIDFPGMSEEECLKYAADLVDKVDFKKVDAYFDRKGQLAVYEKETDIFVKFSKYGLVTMFKPRGYISDKIDKTYWERVKSKRR